MNFIVRNILVVVVGVVLGSVVNMGLVILGLMFIFLFEGVDLSIVEGFVVVLLLLDVCYFFMLFLVYVLGILFGFFIIVRIVVNWEL